MRPPANAAALLLATLAALPACSSTYLPRPSPRIALVQEDGKPMLVKGGRRYEVGTFGGGLIEAVDGSPAALEHAESFRNRTIAGFSMNLGGLAFSLGGMTLMTAGIANDEHQPSAMALTGTAMVASGLGLLIAGLVLTSSAPPHFWDAINIYNDSVPPAPSWPPPTGWPPPAPGTLAPWTPSPGSPPLPAPPPVPPG